ncbi:hypothetical protein DFH09DRAFT_1209554 [Mycena vulgaris]|nr:hypothetical protein DFH09DRAFT_1209554 [Mycena vulgaris]
MLQHSTGGFTPQILTVGDTFNLNNSLFNWTITAAFNDVNTTQSVQTFSYYNNPFSHGCDVVSTHSGLANSASHARVDVTCHIPTLFTLTWNGGLSYGGNPAENDLYSFAWCLIFRPSLQLLPSIFREVDTFGITVQPCCECGGVTTATSTELPTQAPCRLRPARFVRLVGYFGSPDHQTIYEGGFTLFSGNDISSSALNIMFLNTFQSLYHLVRLEIGLILENQIYASPEMYNLSIAPVYVPGPFFDPWVSGSLASTSNATVMAEWRDTVRLFNESDRVPVMGYLRPVLRLKPLGSAITSVFVSTFAMLSVLWTIFSLIAGALAGSYSVCDGSEASLFTPEKEDNLASLRTLVQRLSLTVENNNMQMELNFARITLALRKHGILADGDAKNRSDVEDDITDLQHQDSHSLLMQRSNRRGSLDSLV